MVREWNGCSENIVISKLRSLSVWLLWAKYEWTQREIRLVKPKTTFLTVPLLIFGLAIWAAATCDVTFSIFPESATEQMGRGGRVRFRNSRVALEGYLEHLGHNSRWLSPIPFRGSTLGTRVLGRLKSAAGSDSCRGLFKGLHGS